MGSRKLPRFRASFIHEHSSCHVITDKKDAIDTAERTLIRELKILNEFVKEYPSWRDSLVPIRIENAPPVAKRMEKASAPCNVGPMASVAGVLADIMVEEMIRIHDCRIGVVENGGEIAIKSDEEIIIALDVLTSSLGKNLGFKYTPDLGYIGVGTSSGQFGHAFSFGEADAVTVFADNAGLADAAATFICNNVIGEDFDKAIKNALPLIHQIPGVWGVMIVRGDLIGTEGKIPPLIRIKE